MISGKFPQNYILRKPGFGIFVFMVFCFLFLNLYRPFQTHESRYLNYAATMAVYCFVFSCFAYLAIRVLKSCRYFSNPEEWTILKESFAIFIVLSVTGITIYFLGFVMEQPDPRWNLKTFLNSYLTGFLLGVLPFGYFTLTGYRSAAASQTKGNQIREDGGPQEKPISIVSKLKKEELSFHPGQFIYAEADGNYVVFYLNDGQKIRREVIRNSMGEIEKQLSVVPYLLRVHRAFIVNVKKVYAQKGNSLGYRLKLWDANAVIPVSRQNTPVFESAIKKYGEPSVTKNYHP